MIMSKDLKCCLKRTRNRIMLKVLKVRSFNSYYDYDKETIKNKWEMMETENDECQRYLLANARLTSHAGSRREIDRWNCLYIIYIYIYIHISIYIYIYIHVHIYRERERDVYICIYIYIYTHVYTHICAIHMYRDSIDSQARQPCGFSRHGLSYMYTYIYIYIYIHLYSIITYATSHAGDPGSPAMRVLALLAVAAALGSR